LKGLKNRWKYSRDKKICHINNLKSKFKWGKKRANVQNQVLVLVQAHLLPLPPHHLRHRRNQSKKNKKYKQRNDKSMSKEIDKIVKDIIITKIKATLSKIEKSSLN
jgi:hypothetical protein